MGPNARVLIGRLRRRCAPSVSQTQYGLNPFQAACGEPGAGGGSAVSSFPHSRACVQKPPSTPPPRFMEINRLTSASFFQCVKN